MPTYHHIMQENRFHKTDTFFTEGRARLISNAIIDNRITNNDANLINEFITEIIATHHIKPQRAYKLAVILINLRRFIGPYLDNDIMDVYKGLEQIQAAGYKQNTTTEYNKNLKRFYLWLVENNKSNIIEKKLRKITIGKTDAMTKTCESLIGDEDVKNMINACQYSRDRALIVMLYEGAFRVGELGNLKWGKVKFIEVNNTITSIIVNVDDKTCKPRMIPLYKSVPYLAAWRQDYPAKIESDAYVFITRDRKLQLQYYGVAKQLSKIAKRAGIIKHLTPHIFRHSSITQMIREGMPEPVIKKICWGTTETDQFKTYAHLVDADVERAVALRNGILQPEKIDRNKSLEPLQCKRCYTINMPGQDFCGKCGRPLTENAMKTQEDYEQKAIELRKDPKMIEVMIKKLQQEQIELLKK